MSHFVHTGDLKIIFSSVHNSSIYYKHFNQRKFIIYATFSTKSKQSKTFQNIKKKDKKFNCRSCSNTQDLNFAQEFYFLCLGLTFEVRGWGEGGGGGCLPQVKSEITPLSTRFGWSNNLSRKIFQSTQPTTVQWKYETYRIFPWKTKFMFYVQQASSQSCRLPTTEITRKIYI